MQKLFYNNNKKSKLQYLHHNIDIFSKALQSILPQIFNSAYISYKLRFVEQNVLS